MNRGYLLILFVLIPFTSGIAQKEVAQQDISNLNFNPALLQWYKTPATKWEDALPVGNGRLGAMVYGNPQEEIIQLNEDTYWTGGPYSSVVKGGYKKAERNSAIS